MRLSKIACAAVLGLAGSAFAAPVNYVADFATGNGTVTGTVGGFSWFLENGAGVNFIRFFANAGQTVTLDADRLHANLDPALSVYAGSTNADTSLFAAEGDWGGLTFLFSLDDETGPAVPGGPFGDPFGSFFVSATGHYTVAIGGGSGSANSGNYGYRLTVTAVPEPATPLMVALALGALALTSRQRPRIG